MILICLFLLSLFSVNALEPTLTVQVPMRDGCMLSTDLYFPPNEAVENCPCVLLRSPAGRKNSYAVRYAAISQYGYVVAIQDTRSAIDKEGKIFPGLSDGWGALQDGYDTVEWLAASPYSNGKIGTTGVSALGITQYLLAPTAPPSLKCQYIGVAASSMYHHALRPGGEILKDQVEGWLGLYAKDTGVHAFAYTRPFYNHFWEGFNTVKQAEKVTVPALHYGGWYDTFLQGTIDGFLSRNEKGGEGAKGTQKLVIGPWTHFWPESNRLGDFSIPPGGQQPPIDMSCVAWFDYHLKGIKNSVEKMPTVVYYVMGAFDESHGSGNFWRFADRWPPPSKMTPYFLTVDGELTSFFRPNRKGKTLTYMSDPRDPVPTVGGRNLFIESGPKDQQEIEKRKDVLVFTSPPLEEDLEVTGHVTARLFFSSSCSDTDVVVRLTDVYPDGKSLLISDGMYRTGMGTHEAEVPFALDVDLGATSIVFGKGHRIRISVSGSNYPKYDLNCHLGFVGAHKGRYAVARNCLYMSEEYPSQILLPVYTESTSRFGF